MAIGAITIAITACGDDAATTTDSEAAATTADAGFVPTASMYEQFAGPSSGAMRGMEFGMTPDEVKAKETAMLDEKYSDENTLIYTIADDENVEFEFEYSFYDGKLDGVKMGIGIVTAEGRRNAAEEEALFNDFVAKITTILGAPTHVEEGKTSWNTKNGNGKVYTRKNVGKTLNMNLVVNTNEAEE